MLNEVQAALINIDTMLTDLGNSASALNTLASIARNIAANNDIYTITHDITIIEDNLDRAIAATQKTRNDIDVLLKAIDS